MASALNDFEKDGDLIRCAGGDDVGGIIKLLLDVRAAGKLRAVGIDPQGAHELADALGALGDDFLVCDDPDEIRIWWSNAAVLGRGPVRVSLGPCCSIA